MSYPAAQWERKAKAALYPAAPERQLQDALPAASLSAKADPAKRALTLSTASRLGRPSQVGVGTYSSSAVYRTPDSATTT